MSRVCDVTVATTAFFRVKAIKRLLHSLQGAGYEVLVLDQNEKPFRLDAYDVTHITIPFDSGIGYVHNKAAELIETEYILWLDDDMVFDQGALDILLEDMAEYPDLGWVSPFFMRMPQQLLQPDGHNLKLRDGIIYKEQVEVDGFTFCDEPASPGLYRVALYDDVQWVEEIKTCWVHELFALDCKDMDWRTGIDNRAVFEHWMDKSGEYRNYRWRRRESLKWMSTHRGIKGLKGGIYGVNVMIGKDGELTKVE